ncbi:hypothetical protein D3C86_1616120 [compost metagenome]
MGDRKAGAEDVDRDREAEFVALPAVEEADRQAQEPAFAAVREVLEASHEPLKLPDLVESQVAKGRLSAEGDPVSFEIFPVGLTRVDHDDGPQLLCRG